ncbi:ATP-dependent helicase [Bacillus sp. ISL-39]|uniref:UvrD-helicase domain-containing protein n=1 Tax=Bacillus sp. ISL-39 TaxID=2819124 RepID=UPI001BE8CB6E|nr:ATP-dependent helicase [Bacillus sp. ISL-39]MBT2639854.1 ATP-dependent helicase [Bacillus sp. ISL-39]
MMKKINWQASGGISLEHAAELAVKSNRNTLVVAGPGAGKTELLAQRASYLLETKTCEEPRKILAISFKVDAADNLQKRVEKRVGSELAKRFESRTFDSFAKSILDRFRLALPSEYQPLSEYNLIFNDGELKDIVKGFVTEQHPTHPNWQYEINFGTLFKRFTESPLPFYEGFDDLYSWVGLRLWNVMVKGQGSFQSSLTFPMIARLAEYILKVNPMITTALRTTYSHVFLDEFQDTTYIQYDLLKKAFLGSSSVLTAVGDDKQRIMGWAGAMENSFKEFSADFDSETHHLIFNHRSAPRLVEIQNVLSQSINTNSVNVRCSDKWTSEDGICEVWTFRDHVREAKHISEFVKLKLEQSKPREICILVKQQESIYAKQIIEELSKLGIQSRVEKEFQDILSEDYVNLIVDILKITQLKSAADSWQSVISILIDLKGLDYNEEIENIWEIELQLEKFIQELKYVMKNVPNDIKEVKNYITDLFEKITHFIGLEKIKNFYVKYSTGNLLEKTREKAIEKMCESFLKHQEWEKAIQDFLGEFSIPIMTIHKSKGLEYDTVFFIGLEDDAFWSFRKQSESDIRAFFVALSRAKNEVYFTFCESREIKKFGRMQTANQNRANISFLYQMLVEAQVETKNY